jgi:long-chain acyl-CoA synthetase
VGTDESTITRLLRRNATEFGDLPALTSTAGGAELTLSWQQVRERVAGLTHGLAAMGLGRGERMLIMMSSRPEHWLVDLAAVHVGAIPCTAYATLAGEQIGYVARHSGATVVVLEGAGELDRWRPVLGDLPALRTIVLLDAAILPTDDPRFVSLDAVTQAGTALHQQDPARFEELTDRVEPADPVAMMYTSGTTGDPKGVVLSHSNVILESLAIDEISPMPMHMPTIAYLPLAHIAERELSIYRAIHQGSHITICPDPGQVLAALREVRPPAFFGVPRVWEKMAAGLRGALDAAEPAQRAAVEAASELRLRAYRLRGDHAAVRHGHRGAVQTLMTPKTRVGQEAPHGFSASESVAAL